MQQRFVANVHGLHMSNARTHRAIDESFLMHTSPNHGLATGCDRWEEPSFR
jgi:hypothetical protein